MLQPHMIAVKLGRMGALSLPAGMGLWDVGTACNRASCQAVAGEEERGTFEILCTVASIPYFFGCLRGTITVCMKVRGPVPRSYALL